MKLVYKDTGIPVQVGDKVNLPNARGCVVEFFSPPHKPASEGRVLISNGPDLQQEFYVSVIGAEWIEREERITPVINHRDLLVKVIKELEAAHKQLRFPEEELGLSGEETHAFLNARDEIKIAAQRLRMIEGALGRSNHA